MTPEEYRAKLLELKPSDYSEYERSYIIQGNGSNTYYVIPKEWNLITHEDLRVGKAWLDRRLRDFGVTIREWYNRFILNMAEWWEPNGHRCPNCGKVTNFRHIVEGYSEYCSHECFGEYLKNHPEEFPEYNEKIKTGSHFAERDEAIYAQPNIRPFPKNSNTDVSIQYDRDYLVRGKYYVIPREWSIKEDCEQIVPYNQMNKVCSYNGVTTREWYNRWILRMSEWEEPAGPKCPVCGKPVQFRGPRFGYRKFCSNHCSKVYRDSHREEYPVYDDFLRNGGGYGILRDYQRTLIRTCKLTMLSELNLDNIDDFKVLLKSLAISYGISGLTSKFNKLIPFRSNLEYNFLNWLEHCGEEVLEIEYEPFGIDYIVGDEIFKYFPDFKVKFRDRTVIFEVKPEGFFELENNIKKRESLEDYCNKEGFECYYFSEIDIEEKVYPAQEERIEHLLAKFGLIGDEE